MANNTIATVYDNTGSPVASTLAGAASLVSVTAVPAYGKLATHPGMPAMTSLSAATVAGPAPASGTFNLGFCHQNFTLAVTVTGAPTACAVQLQGSLDNVNWFSIGAASSNTSGTAAVSTANTPAQWVRANLTTLTGGTAPTVTAAIGCAS